MRISWINHASYVLEIGNIKLITDPWIEGRVFNESWSLLVPTKFKYNDFKEITHIWFSHEHPDHFFPPNLKKIPPEFRKNITVLFQKTKDLKVAEYCNNLDFKSVVELDEYDTFKLDEDVEITIGKVENDTDSWLFLKTSNHSVLNLNDCVFNQQKLDKLRNYLGKVDVLLTQFSFANWIGNKDDIEEMKKHAIRKQIEIKKYIQCFKPKYTIPFASYVWFCHQDNFHFNNYANKIDFIADYIAKLCSTPVVLSPGDTWIVGEKHDSSPAIKRYLCAFDKIEEQDLASFGSISWEDLKEQSKAYTDKCLSRNNNNKLLSYKPMYLHLSDYDKVFSYSFKSGLNKVDKKRDEADISFHSQNLSYCFKFDWGYDTILIAGTFEKPPKGNFENFMEYQWVARLNNQGLKMKGVVGRSLDKLIK